MLRKYDLDVGSIFVKKNNSLGMNSNFNTSFNQNNTKYLSSYINNSNTNIAPSSTEDKKYENWLRNLNNYRKSSIVDKDFDERVGFYNRNLKRSPENTITHNTTSLRNKDKNLSLNTSVTRNNDKYRKHSDTCVIKSKEELNLNK